MKELFYLSQEQIDRIKCYFPRSHGIPRVDDRRIVSGIIYVIKQGLQWFRNALSSKGITPCIPGRRSRKVPVAYDKELYKQRHKIEIMFGRLKDWRRIATRYDRCAHTFFSAICIAAIVIFFI